nr:PREDICTED: uncharacterized protein LOC103314283 [Tribolium castaneum]|eukprot:XP_008198118.1 PREDICTED: uncharacterized protein LOC103314283 [Tribolium castaneum]
MVVTNFYISQVLWVIEDGTGRKNSMSWCGSGYFIVRSENLCINALRTSLSIVKQISKAINVKKMEISLTSHCDIIIGRRRVLPSTKIRSPIHQSLAIFVSTCI